MYSRDVYRYLLCVRNITFEFKINAPENKIDRKNIIRFNISFSLNTYLLCDCNYNIS